jgi:tRNA threonylcarbamoyladenosine biosynthesis protein TsaB
MVALLSSAGFRPSELGLLAVAVGPGSFTGLRVGISFVKGLAAGLDLPCLAVNTLDAMACSCQVGDGWLSPMIDARKDEIYTALYQMRNGLPARQTGYLSTDPAGWLAGLPEGSLLFGSGEARYRELAATYPSLRMDQDFLAAGRMLNGMVLLAERLFREGAAINAREISACYIRPADAKTGSGPR